MSRAPLPPPRKIVDPRLRRTIVRTGTPSRVLGDLYHALLNAHWSMLLLLFVVYYLIANTIFALLYLAGGDDLANAHPGSFEDAFFFSVQTLATIGYGAFAPKTRYANTLVAIEALVGVVSFAIAAGLFFAKFSRPTARVLFSRVAVITRRDGVPSLMIRMANERANQVVEAQVQVSLIRSERTVEGEQVRRFYDLDLIRTRTPIFMLSWTVVHPITEASPLYGTTPESFAEGNGEVVVSVAGVDETFSQTIRARYSYLPEEIRWNARFVDIMSVLPDGRRRVDYALFHEVVAETVPWETVAPI
ncbi:MAG TPA: ion channel [Candidatus Binatia bacterium]|jgi:inward rectifier potassium channel